MHTHIEDFGSGGGLLLSACKEWGWLLRWMQH